MKKELLLSASAIALVVGCSDNTVVNSFDEAKSKATITVSVLDGSSNEALDSAKVKPQFEDESSYTDKNGFVSYTKNDIGAYVFDISKKGYSTTRATVSVVEMGANDVSRVPDVLLTVPLYKADVYGTHHWQYEGQHANYGNNTSDFHGAKKELNITEFHMYKLTWDEKLIAMYVDDFKYHEMSIEDNAGGTEAFHKR